MSERYFITEMQLGMLLSTTDEGLKIRLRNEIMDNQYLGSYRTEEEKESFMERIKHIFRQE